MILFIFSLIMESWLLWNVGFYRSFLQFFKKSLLIILNDINSEKKIRATAGRGLKFQLGIFRVLDDVISTFKILPSRILRSKCNVDTSKGHLYVVSDDNIPSIPFMN